ncbi:MAG TPA: hypothetical protein VF832_03365 [Longimicrobiales bacterium]
MAVLAETAAARPKAAPPRRGLTDALLGGALALCALASLVGMPMAAERIPDGGARLELLLWTGVLALLLAVPAARLRVTAWLAPMVARRATLLQPVLIVAVVLVAALAQVFAFHGMPQFPDTFAELFQARILAAGHLWLPSPERADLVRIANVVDAGGRWYAQYPIGNAALLALDVLTGLSWLAAALIALGLVTGVRALARECTGEGATALSLLLVLASPTLMLSAAAAMSQATTAALAAWALALALRARRQALGIGAELEVAAAHGPRPARRPSGVGAALASGLFTGLAATVRPLDALIVGVVLLVVLVAPAAARLPRLLLWAVAAAAGAAPVLAANALTTGQPLRFGYNVLWGAGTLPGFGLRGPGIVFGPAEALHNTLVDLGGLNLALLEWPVPVLAVVAALVLWRGALSTPLRALVAWAVAHVAAYFFYYHHDFFYGPRFLVPIAPALLVLLADGLVRLARPVETPAGAAAARAPARAGLRSFLTELLFVQLAAAAVLVAWPRLARAGRRDVEAAAAIRDASFGLGRPRAILLVDDGWGSRLIAEMWRAGVSAPAADRLYATVDACRLEWAIRLVQRNGLFGPAAETELRNLTAGAGPGIAVRRPPAPRLRLPAGPLLPECAEEMAYDAERLRAPFAPLLWLNDPQERGVVFWRDPGPARLAWLLRDARRPVYRVRVQARPDGEFRVGLEPLLSPGPLRVR